MTELLYEEQTYQLQGLIFEVRKRLMAGWSEEVYHRALVQLLQEKNIPVLFKPRRSFVHRQTEVHVFEPDLIVWDAIILELKVLPYDKNFAGAHYAQLIHYLKFFGKELGLLINFGPTRALIKRVVWSESELEIEENYDEIRKDLSTTDRQCLKLIRHCLITIAKQYGLGYPESLYRKIMALELEFQGLTCELEARIPAPWNRDLLAQQLTDHLLVADQHLINIRSLLERPPLYDFARTKTYLAALGLNFGLVVNFSHKELQIYGVKSG